MAEDRRTCASCGRTNEEDARFCEGCGGSLARVCATCGVEASATARFCRGCGAPLDGQVSMVQDMPVAAPARKTVTVMFADLAGSTSFEERVDAETAREVIGRYHELLRSTAQRHRAGVTKYIGDGFMAVWGAPEIGPDDAAHAVDAAVELQERFVDLAARVGESHGVELTLRVAVNTGEVVVGAGDADLVGDALNVGARLEAECPRGRVVVGEETWRSTRGRYAYESLGEVQVKGRTAPVTAYQHLGRQSDAADATPFVGRADEVRRLAAVLDDAIAARVARLVTVIGDPGVGKSRLAAEFAGAQSDARTVEARCDVEGAVALAPIVEVLRSRDLETDVPASVAERDRLLRDLNGLTAGVPGSVEENFWALRRFVEVLASDGPVLLILDDIQWADALLLDFLEHLVEWVQEAPLLVLALARPELREIRPDLVTVSRWVSEAVHLDGLDARATAQLAAKVLGATQLPDELLRRLPSSTGGNPLFVRELIGMLAHDGVLVQQPTGWRLTIDVDAIAIPPTIHALLASRLERLDAGDRRVLEIASVVGSDFSLGAVRALAGRDAAGISLSLNRLRRLELAQPSGVYVGDEPVWRFHHVLVRDVAYRRLLKSDRADLHEQLAAWVESGDTSTAFEADEVVARHLEAAHAYRSELGTLDEHTGKLALRSARRYAASARRALDRDELVSAGAQAARGAALAAADNSLHAELLLIGCEALLSAGDVAAGAPLVDDLERISDDALTPWATCYRCQFVVYTDPERLLEVDARLQEAIDEFGRRADPAGLAKAHRVRAGARARLGRIGDSEVDLFEALIAARQSGDHRQITAALGAAPGAALWGPSPVPKAGGRCLDVVRMQRMTTAAPSLEATSLRHLAVLELLRGRPDKARTMLANARQIVADLGLRHGLMETELFAGIIESMEGDPIAAEPHFRTALEGLDALGVGADAGLAAALLARSVLAQGRIDEADQYAIESERLAGRNLKTAIAWRAVRGEILAAQNRNDEAVAMALEAAAVAGGTDLVLDHADACLALSRVLGATGDAKGANAARADADRLYAAKEVAPAIGRAVESAPVTALTPAAATAVPTSRLPVTNRATAVIEATIIAMRAQDVDAAVAHFSDPTVFDDRRRLSGAPIGDMRTAMARILEQYNTFDWRTLAVRGDRLHLAWGRWSDDDGNETCHLHVHEVDADGRIIYGGRFDEDDFDGAYRELENRYYSGEGSPVAQNGRALVGFMDALDQLDVEAAHRYSRPDCRWNVPASTLTVRVRSVEDFIGWMQERASQVSSIKNWLSVIRWLSPTCIVARSDIRGVGPDDERYAWSRLNVVELRDGLVASVRQFDVDDAEAAFAYAEERMAATTSRLAVTNPSCEFLPAFRDALRIQDVDGTLRHYSDDFEYADHRRLSGDPIVGLAALRTAIERIFSQYTHFDLRVLAVRGQRLHLMWSRWSDTDGNESTTLYLNETGEDGRVTYHGRFDEDDFESAYRELERRYYAGEGAAFAEAGAVGTEWVLALNQGDFDRVFNELTHPDMRVENRSKSVFGDPSASELRATFEELYTMVASARAWSSAVCWLSPTWGIARFEREAVGQDGEKYAWARLQVVEIRDGQLTSMCRFEVDDEEAAFAYAEERARASASRLAVTNRSCEFVPAFHRALLNRDIDGALKYFSDEFVYDDRRRLSGDPIVGLDAMRTAIERIFAQYNRFGYRVLAVRGQRLNLIWSRWSDDDGNETTTLYVNETGDDGRVRYHARFDEDNFESAYRELDRRFYEGEGAAFAECALAATEAAVALNRGEFDRFVDEFSVPDLHVENRSRSAFPDRSATDLLASFAELDAMVASTRTWMSAVRWLSPTWSATRMEREAVGQDGEQYAWTRILVCEHRDGRFGSMCLFDLEGEDAAFEFAEERLRATASRLAVTNRAGHLVEALASAMRAADIDGAAECYADPFVYDDHRRLSGDPISNAAGMRGAAERLLEQYTQFETRPLAVRGERLYLFRNRLINDAGYETTYLFLYEIGEDGLIHYEGRFDEDDFEGAYRELERRYYAGEGAGFAEAGALSTEWMIALNTGDFDRLFVELTDPGMRIENRSRSPFPDRTASEFRASLEELDAMVSSARTWLSAIHWLSPTWAVIRVEREAVGRDGDAYAWTWLQVSETRDTRLALTCLFELDDEEAAFAYADERMQASASRLPVTNRASEVDHAFARAFGARDLDGVMGYVSDLFVFDDRRQLSGQPIGDVRAAMARILAQYSIFEMRSLAVRGERLHLFWSRWSDDAGNETAHLHVHEVGDECRIVYEGRFDEDDFEGAYRELESRYYAWEGAAFAEQGALGTEWVIALNQGDFDRVFNDLTGPDMRVLNRSLSVFGDPTAAELRASFEELYSMVDSARAWSSALCWLSPMWVVARFEREAVGRDGEKYAWARLQVIEIRDGRLAELCRFEVEDEDAAFAYAEARIRSAASRLTVTNRSSETVQAVSRAMQAHDVEGVVASYADELMYDDRRRLTGDPIHGAAELRAATERILEQYNQFEWRTVAVRGEYLHLTFSRWSNDAGFETTYLHVVEIDDGGRIVYSGRFDDDDFESAYGELERRYYAGEGAAVAETGAVATDWIIAINRDDFDRAFGELSTPDLRVENRSRAPFPDRSATDLRATFEALSARVASARTWNSVMLWLSSTWVVQRLEREAVGPDGEKYEWTRLHVCGFQRGRLATVCQFELDDEEQAFAYAEERVQATASRLAVTNRASEMWEAVGRAMQAHDVDAAVECYSEPLVYDDRRRLGGNPLTDIRTATERVLEQYSEFQGRTLAVRGHRLCLGWSRWVNEAGLETAYLVLNEMRDDGRFVYEGRFDEDNFEGAYLELERRYFAGEGAAFAEGGTLGTEWVTAVNQGDLDRLFGELTSPEMRVENRSRSLFGDLSAAELRAAFEQLHAMVASVRSWNSAECWLDSMCGVVRHEREAVGLDGERYTWTQLFVFEFADGRCVGLCEFELDDEAAAIAYAEERIGSVEA